MFSGKITAVMVHVAEPEIGLAWYQRAIPEAELIVLPEFNNFRYLRVGDIQLEIVPADDKVGEGHRGIAVDWEVADFSTAFEHLQRCGATLYRGPMDIENGWRMCKFLDPFGNLLGIRGPAGD